MSHKIYTTEGIVIKIFRYDTSAGYLIFTREFGLIRAKAQGVRKYNSKLKFGLQEFSVSKFSFVLGKSGFRVTGAIPISNFYFETSDFFKKKAIANISAVLVRLIQGEEDNTLLYDCVLNGFNLIKDSTKENMFYYEILTMVRLLYLLGYVSDSDLNVKNIIENTLENNKEIEVFAKSYSSKILELINIGLKESQL